MEEIRDEQLWLIAKKRIGFKKHLAAYIVVNIFLWLVWWFTIRYTGDNSEYQHMVPWPVWSMLGWGIGLAFNYIAAYHSINEAGAIQSEYDKLKRRG